MELNNEILFLDKTLIFIYLFGVLYLVYKNNKNYVLDFVFALIAAVAISEGIKYLIDKPRPCIEFSNCLFEGSSFPSTHTAVAFTAFFFYVFICHRVSQKSGEGQGRILIKSAEEAVGDIRTYVVLSGAILIAALRLLLNAHDLIDIAVGIFIGFISALPFVYYDVKARRVK